jgi:hypothetical protein
VGPSLYFRLTAFVIIAILSLNFTTVLLLHYSPAGVEPGSIDLGRCSDHFAKPPGRKTFLLPIISKLTDPWHGTVSRVARWNSFKPKISIFIYFWGFGLYMFGIFYVVF